MLMLTVSSQTCYATLNCVQDILIACPMTCLSGALASEVKLDRAKARLSVTWVPGLSLALLSFSICAPTTRVNLVIRVHAVFGILVATVV
jgi:hypothetical protein